MAYDRPTYSIKDWETWFENHESRKVRVTRWVPVPNKHDGKSYRRISRDPKAVEIFCAWNLIIQVASKMPVRGVLVDLDGPLDADDLADKTNYPAEIFEAAFKVLTRSDIAWLACTNGMPLPSEKREIVPPQRETPGENPVTAGDAGTEGKGRTGKGTERKTPPTVEVPPFTSVEFVAAIAEWEQHRIELRKKWTPTAKHRNYLQFIIWGEARSIAAIHFSIQAGYTGIFEDKNALPQTQSPIFFSNDETSEMEKLRLRCTRCNGTGTELTDKGARPCDHLSAEELE